MYLYELIRNCTSGIDRFKIFINETAVAIIEVLDEKIDNIFDEEFVVKNYNVQCTQNGNTMFIYC